MRRASLDSHRTSSVYARLRPRLPLTALRFPASPAVMWNANPLLPQQWAAVALVFGGLLVSSWTKSRRGRHVKHAADPKAQ